MITKIPSFLISFPNGAKELLLTIGNPTIACLLIGHWNKKVPYIHSIFVAKPHRRKGLATKLIKETLRLAKKANKPSVNLWVDKKNKVAKKVYEGLGFVQTGCDDPVMMTKVL